MVNIRILRLDCAEYSSDIIWFIRQAALWVGIIIIIAIYRWGNRGIMREVSKLAGPADSQRQRWVGPVAVCSSARDVSRCAGHQHFRREQCSRKHSLRKATLYDLPKATAGKS